MGGGHYAIKCWTRTPKDYPRLNDTLLLKPKHPGTGTRGQLRGLATATGQYRGGFDSYHTTLSRFMFLKVSNKRWPKKLEMYVTDSDAPNAVFMKYETSFLLDNFENFEGEHTMNLAGPSVPGLPDILYIELVRPDGPVPSEGSL